MKKLNVAVLMGGKSAEHEISLMSGREVVKNLSPHKYNILPVVVAEDGMAWQLTTRQQILLGKRTASKALARLDHSNVIKNNKIDVVLIAMHGPNGEDGTMQGLLELLGIPYTGSGVLASALGMDKIYSRKLFTQAGLNVPKSVVLWKKDNPKEIFKKLKLPLFVKPNNQGSSVGTSKAKNMTELKKALKIAFSYSDPILVEEYIPAIELTCAVLGNSNPKALPLVEIVPKKEFFDLEAKYDAKLTDEIVPARIGKALTLKAQKAALDAYKALGCSGFGRVDMLLKGNRVYVLEVNTIPGLTPVSLFPKAAKAAGLSYQRLLDRLIDLALENARPIVGL
jgi:D-alanine-D-alanine ligase